MQLRALLPTLSPFRRLSQVTGLRGRSLSSSTPSPSTAGYLEDTGLWFGGGGGEGGKMGNYEHTVHCTLREAWERHLGETQGTLGWTTARTSASSPRFQYRQDWPVTKSMAALCASMFCPVSHRGMASNPRTYLDINQLGYFFKSCFEIVPIVASFLTAKCSEVSNNKLLEHRAFLDWGLPMRDFPP